MPSMVPSSNKMPSQHLAFIAVVIAGIVILLAIIMSSLFKPLGIFKTYGQGYKDGYIAARTKLGELDPKFARSSRSDLSGKITSISNNAVTFITPEMFTDPLVDGVTNTRVAKLGPNTILMRQKSLTESEFAAVLKQYQEDSKNTETPRPSSMPASFVQEKIAMTDLKVGDNIVVTSMEGADILHQSSFEAGSISVYTTSTVRSDERAIKPGRNLDGAAEEKPIKAEKERIRNP